MGKHFLKIPPLFSFFAGFIYIFIYIYERWGEDDFFSRPRKAAVNRTLLEVGTCSHSRSRGVKSPFASLPPLSYARDALHRFLLATLFPCIQPPFSPLSILFLFLYFSFIFYLYFYIIFFHIYYFIFIFIFSLVNFFYFN